MQGGDKGLFVNNRNLCLRPARANVAFISHSGLAARLRPIVANDCHRTARPAAATERDSPRRLCPPGQGCPDCARQAGAPG